jgi:hypothetical protein
MQTNTTRMKRTGYQAQHEKRVTDASGSSGSVRGSNARLNVSSLIASELINGAGTSTPVTYVLPLPSSRRNCPLSDLAGVHYVPLQPSAIT